MFHNVGLFCLAAPLLCSSPSLAVTEFGPIRASIIEHDGTAYAFFSTQTEAGARKTLYLMRVSAPGVVQKLFYSRGEPFLLDKSRNIWRLDTSKLRYYLNKAHILSGNAAGVALIWASGVMVADMFVFGSPFYMGNGSEQLVMRFFDWVPLWAIVGSQLSTGMLASFGPTLSFGMIDGANYFTEHLIEGVTALIPVYDGDEWKVFFDEYDPYVSEPLSAIVGSYRKDSCDQLLTKIYSPRVARKMARRRR